MSPILNIHELQIYIRWSNVNWSNIHLCGFANYEEKVGVNMLKMLRTKKENGTIDHLLPGFILVLVSFIIFLVYIDTAAVVTLRDNADVIARQYMLRMESNGWLDESSTENLVTRIEDLSTNGITVDNVKVAGSVAVFDSNYVTSGVTGPVGYANTVTLDIKADIINSKTGRSAWGIPVSASNYSLHIRKQSTAKY